MPNWRKVTTSGSAASFSSLSVDTSITASIVSSSQFTGSLYGTASQAVSSSYAATASSANSNATTPFIVGGAAVYYGTVISSISGSNNIFTIATGSYTAATFQYTAYVWPLRRVKRMLSYFLSVLPIHQAKFIPS